MKFKPNLLWHRFHDFVGIMHAGGICMDESSELYIEIFLLPERQRKSDIFPSSTDTT